jgi:hypothetical protein
MFVLPFLLTTWKGTSLPLSSLPGGEAWIVYIVNHYRRAHSKDSRDRTYTACLTARQVLADLAGMGATVCSQPKTHDEVGEIHAMRLAISQRVSSSSLLTGRRPRERGVVPASRATQPILLGAPSHQVNVQARQHRHPDLAICTECMLYQIRPRSIHSLSTTDKNIG